VRNRAGIAAIGSLTLAFCFAAAAPAQVDPRAARPELATFTFAETAYVHAYYGLYRENAARNAGYAFYYSQTAFYYAHSGWNDMLEHLLRGRIGAGDYAYHWWLQQVYAYYAYYHAYYAHLETRGTYTYNALLYSRYAQLWGSYCQIARISGELGADGLTTELRTLVERHNQVRLTHGLKVLAIDDRLNIAAQKQANWMAQKRTMSHVDANGFRAVDRALREGYQGPVYGVGENLGFGYETESGAFSAWLQSQSHLENILNVNVEHIGLGVARGPDGLRYWAVSVGFGG
jgi:uncharacterized protein YkwD